REERGIRAQCRRGWNAPLRSALNGERRHTHPKFVTGTSGAPMTNAPRHSPNAISVQVSAEPAKIELTHLTKRFLTRSGKPFTAIRDVSFTVEPGEFCAIVGPTGCGKSTTLAQVSGLDRPSAGSVTVGGREVHGITKGVGFMFQSDALFPWKTVLANVMVGPTLN